MATQWEPLENKFINGTNGSKKRMNTVCADTGDKLDFRKAETGIGRHRRRPSARYRRGAAERARSGKIDACQTAAAMEIHSCIFVADRHHRRRAVLFYALGQ